MTQQPAFGKWLPMLCQAQGYKNSEIEHPAWDVLATAVEYKMRSLIEQAIRIAHKSYGTTTALDVASVRTAAKLLRWQKMPRVGCRGLQFEEDAARNNEPVVLDDFLAEENVIPVPTVPALDVSWITVNGKNVSHALVTTARDGCAATPPALWYFKSFDGFHRDFVKKSGDSSLFMKVLMERCDSVQAAAPSALQSVLAVPKALSRYLSDEYRLYLQRLLSCVVQTLQNSANPELTPTEKAQDKLVLTKVMQTLNEGPAPSKLVPFVFAMICALFPPAVAEGPPEAVLIALHVLISYIQNPRVHSKPYLHQIIQALLLTLLAPSMGPINPPALLESLEVRRLASEGLCYVVRNAGSPAAFNSVVEILTATLKKQELPVTTLIGAVIGCTALGDEAVRVAVKPVARSLTHALRQMNFTDADPVLAKCTAELTNILLELITNALQAHRPD